MIILVLTLAVSVGRGEEGNGDSSTISHDHIPHSATQVVPDLVTLINSSDHDVSTMMMALDRAGLLPRFNDTVSATDWTLFVPTDKAFAAASEQLFWLSTSNKTATAATISSQHYKHHLTALLSQHIVMGTQIPIKDLTTGMVVDSLGLERLTFEVIVAQEDAAKVWVRTESSPSAARLLEKDIQVANNGIVHIVDQVLIPRVMALPLGDILPLYNMTLFQQFLSQTGILDTIVNGQGAITLLGLPDHALAPWVELFPRYPNITKLFLNHVILGDPLPSVMMNDSAVVTMATGMEYEFSTNALTIHHGDEYIIPIVATDFIGRNGLVHVLSDLLFPYDNAPCHICVEDDQRITLPDDVLLFTYFTCAKGNALGLSGAIPETWCSLMQAQGNSVCGCQ